MDAAALDLYEYIWPSMVATSDVPPEVLGSLTRSQEKMVAYRVDPYFRHGAHWSGTRLVACRGL
jgi:hypothetical protein